MLIKNTQCHLKLNFLCYFPFAMHVIFQLHNDDLNSTTDELLVYNNIT